MRNLPKKVSFRFPIIIIVLMGLVMLSSCNFSSSNADKEKLKVGSSGLTENKNMLLDKIDDDFISRYITSLDICLIGETELVFDDSALIPTQSLKMFFLYYISNQRPLESERYYGDRWYNHSDKKYHIPISEIKKVLSSSFENYTLINYQLDGYDSKNDEMVMSTISGFGGNRRINVTDKKLVSDDTVMITVDFLDDAHEVYYTKIYTIRINNDDIKYISILKNYEKAKSKLSVIALKYGFIGYTKDKKLYSIWGNTPNTTVLSPGIMLTTEFKTYNKYQKIGQHRLTQEYYSRDTYDNIQNVDALRIMGNEEILWISGDYNPIIRPVTKIDSPDGKYTLEIARRLRESKGTNSPINITEVISADIDGDGKEETFITAYSPRDDWKLKNNEVLSDNIIDKGYVVYSIILMEKDGVYYYVYSEILKSGRHDYIDLFFNAKIIGLFDLDGDGHMEICIDTIHWDVPDILIYKFNGTGIENIMKCGFAW